MAQTVVVSNNGVGANVAVLDPSVIPAGVGEAVWGTITGVLSTQTDLQTVLNGKTATDDPRLSDARTPTVHAPSHKSGGSDAIKLDELAAPTDVTTLNATTSAHGLLQKLPGGTTTFLRADGAFATPVAAAGDTSKHLTSGTSTILTDTSRVVVRRFTIDSGAHLVIAATGSLEVTA